MNNCKYRLPCGWCDKRNVKCDAQANPLNGMNITVDTIPVIRTCDANCPNTDGSICASIPPQVRCNITGEYRVIGSLCNASKAESTNGYTAIETKVNNLDTTLTNCQTEVEG